MPCNISKKLYGDFPFTKGVTIGKPEISKITKLPAKISRLSTRNDIYKKALSVGTARRI